MSQTRRRLRRSEAVVFVCSALLLALPVGLFLVRPVALSVDGNPCRVARRGTVADALRSAGLRATPGDVLALDGAVLQREGGQPPTAWRLGQPLALAALVGRHDALTVTPAQDVREPIREQTRLLPNVALNGYAPSALTGTQRLQVGLLSGQALVETVGAVPTVTTTTATKKPRRLALTFDDGPWPNTTSQLLSLLAKHDAHATFFVVGRQATANAALLRRVTADGNELGVHTWAHANLARASAGAIVADLNRCRSLLEKLTDQKIRVMRPPYGALDAGARSAIRQTGLHITMWDVDTNDWRRPSADTIYARIMNGARSGAIVLCHDGGGPRANTVAAVARAVPALQARGYELVTVSQLLGLEPKPEGGALILANGRRLDVKPIKPSVVVLVDGKPTTLPEAPVEMDGQLLVPVRPILDLLRVKWTWTQSAQTLAATGPFEQATLRLNSVKIETSGGISEEMAVPPVLYRNALMIPLWAALRLGEARAQYDAATHTLRLTSFDEELRSLTEGNVAPADWGRGLKWREYLGGK